MVDGMIRNLISDIYRNAHPMASEWLKISPVTSCDSPNGVSTSHDVTERKKPDPNSDASDDGLL